MISSINVFFNKYDRLCTKVNFCVRRKLFDFQVMNWRNAIPSQPLPFRIRILDPEWCGMIVFGSTVDNLLWFMSSLFSRYCEESKHVAFFAFEFRVLNVFSWFSHVSKNFTSNSIHSPFGIQKDCLGILHHYPLNYFISRHIMIWIHCTYFKCITLFTLVTWFTLLPKYWLNLI